MTSQCQLANIISVSGEFNNLIFCWLSLKCKLNKHLSNFRNSWHLISTQNIMQSARQLRSSNTFLFSQNIISSDVMWPVGSGSAFTDRHKNFAFFSKVFRLSGLIRARNRVLLLRISRLGVVWWADHRTLTPVVVREGNILEYRSPVTNGTGCSEIS